MLSQDISQCTPVVYFNILWFGNFLALLGACILILVGIFGLWLILMLRDKIIRTKQRLFSHQEFQDLDNDNEKD